MEFTVRNGRARLKLIPYVGCKSGFSHIFNALIPDSPGRIYDVFGGGGGFTFYACKRFGSENTTYNDHNPVLVNLVRALKEDPGGLCAEYEIHRAASSPEHYIESRRADISGGTPGAARFLYLAKNAFSGKIRFNSKNEFNCPMRKGAKCPNIDSDNIRKLSRTIRDLEIRCGDYTKYVGVSGSFIYLDPPYMNNPNSHYNATVPPDDFAEFVGAIHGTNMVMISEQSSAKDLRLPGGFAEYPVRLKRSLQYYTKDESAEIIAINYAT